ncbi:MAG: hypothetical protein AB7E55_30115 [Pigmentiphaga sp.]
MSTPSITRGSFVKPIFFSAVVVLLVSFALVTQASAKEWYEGGTLHETNLATWATASDENKLATSADFAAATGKMTSMKEMAMAATAIAMCIDKVAAEPVAGTQVVYQIAAMCMVQMDVFRD